MSGTNLRDLPGASKAGYRVGINQEETTVVVTDGGGKDVVCDRKETKVLTAGFFGDLQFFLVARERGEVRVWDKAGSEWTQGMKFHLQGGKVVSACLSESTLFYVLEEVEKGYSLNAMHLAPADTPLTTSTLTSQSKQPAGVTLHTFLAQTELSIYPASSSSAVWIVTRGELLLVTARPDEAPTVVGVQVQDKHAYDEGSRSVTCWSLGTHSTRFTEDGTKICAEALPPPPTPDAPVDWYSDLPADPIDRPTPPPPPAPASSNVLRSWIEATTPSEIFEASGRLMELLEPLEPVVDREKLARCFFSKRIIRKRQQAASKDQQECEKFPTSKQVRFTLPEAEGGTESVLDSEWSSRVASYDAVTVDNVFWKAVKSADEAAEELWLSTATQVDPEGDDVPADELDLFHALLTASNAGEDRPAHGTDLPDPAAVIDDLGMYCLTDKHTQITFLRESNFVTTTPTCPGSAHGITLPLPWQRVLHRRASFPEVLRDLMGLIPVYLVPIIVVLLSDFGASDTQVLRWVSKSLLSGVLRVHLDEEVAEKASWAHRSGSRVMSLLLLWSGDVTGSVCRAVKARDVRFLTNVVKEISDTEHLHRPERFFIARLVLEHMGLTSDLQLWTHFGVFNDIDDGISSVLDELQPVTPCDVADLRDMLYEVLATEKGGGVDYRNLSPLVGSAYQQADHGGEYTEGCGQLVGIIAGYMHGSVGDDQLVRTIKLYLETSPPSLQTTLRSVLASSPSQWDFAQSKFATPLTHEHALRLVQSLTSPIAEPPDLLSLTLSSTSTAGGPHPANVPILLPPNALNDDCGLLDVPLERVLPMLVKKEGK
eukprot:TRINITY_DN33659_c0_g1_i1.p1 TRINITY_DN33659_c0_g1~~TRINITY_DN33659_c0_g1_i1.p1  ORF type:complete len:826 (+),score=149.51 TRINITY_DN33659_c0_g1_i1:128-2605(+)